jgi:hypothetical protein
MSVVEVVVVTLDCREATPKGLEFYALHAQPLNRGEFFEIYAIAKERYRVKTFRDAKNILQGDSLRFALEKFGLGRFRSLETTDLYGATSDDRRLGRRGVFASKTLRYTTIVKSMGRRAKAA